MPNQVTVLGLAFQDATQYDGFWCLTSSFGAEYRFGLGLHNRSGKPHQTLSKTRQERNSVSMQNFRNKDQNKGESFFEIWWLLVSFVGEVTKAAETNWLSFDTHKSCVRDVWKQDYVLCPEYGRRTHFAGLKIQ